MYKVRAWATRTRLCFYPQKFRHILCKMHRPCTSRCCSDLVHRIVETRIDMRILVLPTYPTDLTQKCRKRYRTVRPTRSCSAQGNYWPKSSRHQTVHSCCVAYVGLLSNASSAAQAGGIQPGSAILPMHPGVLCLITMIRFHSRMVAQTQL